MDVRDGALLLAGDPAGGVYSLSQLDVEHVFDFLWFMSIAQVFQFVMLVLIAGLIFGIILTKKWNV